MSALSGEGWKCPVCLSGVAPWLSRCDHGGSSAASVTTRVPVTPKPFTGGSSLDWHTCSRCGAFRERGLHVCQPSSATINLDGVA